MEIGDRIKQIRREKGLTQAGLALLANISRSYLADIERSRYNPSVETLMVISKALNVGVTDLIGSSLNVELSERLRIILLEVTEGPFNKRMFKKEINNEIINSLESIQSKYSIDFEFTPDGIMDRARSEEEYFAIEVIKALETAKGKIQKRDLSPVEERDIAIDLERMISSLDSKDAMAFQGEPMDDETKELMRISLENSLRLAKQMAKKKFNPNKYK